MQRMVQRLAMQFAQCLWSKANKFTLLNETISINSVVVAGGGSLHRRLQRQKGTHRTDSTRLE